MVDMVFGYVVGSYALPVFNMDVWEGYVLIRFASKLRMKNITPLNLNLSAISRLTNGISIRIFFT